ncbi:MAG TPA: type II secretion system protein [Candidatus Limnocylindrales bacterium]|nr:type II secretion system protein [Candidatus Limnocylindrales bacterium]
MNNIIKFRKKNKNLKFALHGFTLIELLMSLGISGFVGAIIISILFTTLRVSKRTDLIVVLKYNGNSAISQVSKAIRYTKKLNSPSSCISPVRTTSITVTSLENESTTFVCTGGSSATIESNGLSLIDTNSAVATNCSFTCTQNTLNDPPTIKFSFVLNSKNPSNIWEQRVSIPFDTSVTLRNYSQ